MKEEQIEVVTSGMCNGHAETGKHYLYSISFIDWWKQAGWMSFSEVTAPISDPDAMDEGEGSGESRLSVDDAMYLRDLLIDAVGFKNLRSGDAFYMALPGADYDATFKGHLDKWCVAVKLDNNGETMIMSPQRLPWLE